MGGTTAKLRFSQSFLDTYDKLPQAIRQKTDRQLQRLIENPAHPSLRVRKMAGGGLWEGRVDYYYRFTFERTQGIYRLTALGRHDIYDRP